MLKEPFLSSKLAKRLHVRLTHPQLVAIEADRMMRHLVKIQYTERIQIRLLLKPTKDNNRFN